MTQGCKAFRWYKLFSTFSNSYDSSFLDPGWKHMRTNNNKNTHNINNKNTKANRNLNLTSNGK